MATIKTTSQNSAEILSSVFSEDQINSLKSTLSESAMNNLTNNLAKAQSNGTLNNSNYNNYISSTNSKESIYATIGKTTGDEGGLGLGITTKSSVGSLDEYGVINMPHQWTQEADPRVLKGDWRGRAYTQHIIDNVPAVMLKVGKPHYMLSKDADSKAQLGSLMNLEDDEERTEWLNKAFGKITKNQSYYYVFEDDWNNYCDYVNSMIRYTAVNMGIDEYNDFDLKKDTHKRTNSGNWLKDFFNQTLTLTHYLAFYAEASGTGDSESGSNNTGDSQLASGMKSLGQTKRELDFLFGADTRANNNADSTLDSYNEWAKNLKSSYTGINGIDNIINKLSGAATSIMTGANILFPEIWSDSSFRASFNLELKLHSPYGDKISIFENIYMPLIMLLAMTLPRQAGKQGYTGPFIVQCWAKGWFTVNCGIIESIDIKKGGSGKEWSVDNLPTEIDISISIKDLYPTIMSTSKKSGNIAFANNIGLTDYLKTLSGIQLTDFNPDRYIDQTLISLGNTFKDIPTKIYTKTQAVIGKGAKAAITKIFGGLN